jgi:death-on-curing protein
MTDSSLRWLEYRHVLLIVDRERIGPVRDVGLVESALFRPQTTLMGNYAYASLAQKAAALLHSLCLNHPLVDGNNRLAAAATLIFLRINGHRAALDPDALFELVMSVAEGGLREVPDIAAALRVVPVVPQ